MEYETKRSKQSEFELLGGRKKEKKNRKMMGLELNDSKMSITTKYMLVVVGCSGIRI